MTEPLDDQPFPIVPWALFGAAVVVHGIGLTGDQGVITGFFLGGVLSGIGVVASYSRRAAGAAVMNVLVLIIDGFGLCYFGIS